MSVNKDLEIIKKCVEHYGLVEDVDYNKDILESAERAAAKFEHLNTLLNEESIRANVLERCVEEREAEIARLKAELEKRPEIIKCKNCKFKKHCGQSILRFNEKDNEDFFDKKVLFCSNGQRKSEAGK